MTTLPVALILGAGPRIGASVAEKFAGLGYRVAVASRKGTGGKTPEGYFSLQAELTKPESLAALFEDVKKELGVAPNVVIYNAAALTPPPDANSVLSIPLRAVASDLNVNVVSPYAAAQQAVSAWETLPTDTKKTFIYTGNILNVSVLPVPMMLNLGMGKAASAFWVGVADTMYSAKGYRFFYADERTQDGKIKGPELDGPAHAEFYAQLAAHEGSVPWRATFVKGKGYVKFE